MILIKNGRVWSGTQFQEGDVLMEHDKVKRIGVVGREDAARVEFVFDAGGCIVAPGFVDIHTHMRNISSDEFGICPEAVCFPFGVTAAVDAGCVQGGKVWLDALAVKNGIFVNAPIRANKVDFNETERLLGEYGEKVLGIKAYFDSTSGQVTDTKPLREICEYAHSWGLKVMVHCSYAPVSMEEVFGCLEKGDICTHTYHGIKSTVLEDAFASLMEAKERGVVIDSGMAGGVHTDFEILKAAIEAGAAPDTISSDITLCSAFKRGGRYGLTTCMSIMRHLGMGEEQILKALTSEAAKAVGKQSEWGLLREGHCADVAVLRYTDEGFDMTDKAGNLIQSDRGYRCVMTIADGQVVYRD